ncbi:MAG: DUF4362 domain-containing protein [Acidimicrobiia bacterium]|nr:DUF4362 domain-containing protein [Acidimicrobiia bacterium]
MIRRLAIWGFLAVFAAGCAAGQESEERPVFGEIDGGCGVTVLTNDVGDEALLSAGVDCLLDAVDAQRPVVWDLLVPTVEGDPILYRFEGDGRKLTIIEDATRDEFGRSRSAVVQECDSVDDTGFVPVGADCPAASGAPFVLPAGIWPP